MNEILRLDRDFLIQVRKNGSLPFFNILRPAATSNPVKELKETKYVI